MSSLFKGTQVSHLLFTNVSPSRTYSLLESHSPGEPSEAAIIFEALLSVARNQYHNGLSVSLEVLGLKCLSQSGCARYETND